MKNIDKIKAISRSRNIDNLDKKYMPETDISDYFFISYSHRDYRKVYKDLVLLKEQGLKIWYDKDIPGGTNWKEVAARFMAPIICKGVIFYLSENSLKDFETSKQTIAELEYAKTLGKPIISINLASDDKTNKQTVVSARKMIDGLIEKGRKDLETIKEDIIKIFPDEVIYLPINLKSDFKASRIMGHLKEIPKIRFNNDIIMRVSDTTIINISEQDFIKSFMESSLASTPYIDPSIYIESCAFANCDNLEYICLKVPDAKINIGWAKEFAFSNCSKLKKIDMEYQFSLTLLTGVFYNCSSLEELDGVIQIDGDSVFFNCESLKRITLNDYSRIGDNCFAHCISLEEVEYSGVQSSGVNDYHKIGKYAFGDCRSLKKINLPNFITEIGESAFSGCESLEEMILPYSLVSLGDMALNYCTSLRKIMMGEYLQSINFSYNFSNDPNLEDIYISPENKTYRAVNNVVYKGDTLLYYPRGLKNESFTVSDDIKVIAKEAFLLNNHLKEINIGPNTEEMSDSFKALYSLERINVSEDNRNFKSVDGILYSKNKKILFFIPSKAVDKEFIFPDETIYYEPDALFDCVSLEKIDFKNVVKQQIIVSHLNVKEIVLPDEMVYTPVFVKCNKLEKITIKNNEHYKNYGDTNYFCYFDEDHVTLLFAPRTKTTVNIPEGITRVDTDAFNDMNVTTIIVPSSFKTLKGFTLMNTVKKICLPNNIVPSCYIFNIFPNIEEIHYDGEWEPIRKSLQDTLEEYFAAVSAREKETKFVFKGGSFILPLAKK